MLKRLLSGFSLAVAWMVLPGHAADAPFVAQTSSEQGVKVTVAPPVFSTQVQFWDFSVALETHTRALDDDLAKSSTLIADGKQYPPAAWEGAPPGGHHRKGLLRFKPVTPLPTSVELQIRLTGENGPRKFLWSLKGAGNGY